MKFQRIALDSIVKLGDEVKQGYSREGQTNVNLQMDGKKQTNIAGKFLNHFLRIDLLRKLNALEESINDRHRQLNGAIEQRREFDRIISKLSDWIKTTEQQIKDPFASDLQQNASGIKDKHRSIQVSIQNPRQKIPFVFILVITSICTRS